MSANKKPDTIALAREFKEFLSSLGIDVDQVSNIQVVNKPKAQKVALAINLAMQLFIVAPIAFIAKDVSVLVFMVQAVSSFLVCAVVLWAWMDTGKQDELRASHDANPFIHKYSSLAITSENQSLTLPAQAVIVNSKTQQKTNPIDLCSLIVLCSKNACAIMREGAVNATS